VIEHIRVEGACVPEAYEKAILAVWDQGIHIKTQYDKPKDPESRDAHVTVVVRDPFAEPRYHKNFPGGPADLQTYVMEVVEGIHDHWIDLGNPTKWQYTYHERLFRYLTLTWRFGEATGTFVDQVESMCQALAKCPYTRRAQATTWRPGYDDTIADPPCLQRLWGRIIQEHGINRLQLHTYWRSRDLYKAWFMNVVALTELQAFMARRITELGCPCEVGEYHDTSDSLHVYGSYFKEALPRIEKLRDGNWMSRCFVGEGNSIFVEAMKEQEEKLRREAGREEQHA